MSAKRVCEASQGTLATIPTTEVQSYIRERFGSSSKSKRFWLGANDRNREGSWEWVTGEVSRVNDVRMVWIFPCFYFLNIRVGFIYLCHLSLLIVSCLHMSSVTYHSSDSDSPTGIGVVLLTRGITTVFNLTTASACGATKIAALTSLSFANTWVSDVEMLKLLMFLPF